MQAAVPAFDAPSEGILGYRRFLLRFGHTPVLQVNAREDRNPNNASGDQYCPACGTELTEDVLSEANAVRAKIMRDVSDLLDINGQSLEQRVRTAIATIRKET